jgi:hypothetical protein
MSEEEFATEKQLKMYAALLHRLAETNKRDYKEMREEVKDMFGFSNAAKLKKSEMSGIITKLMEWIGGGEGAKVIDGDCDKEEDLTVSDEYEDLEVNSEYTEEEEKKEENEDIVKQYVDLYARIWEEVLKNKTFAQIGEREQGIAVAGVFREVIKTRRTEGIAELRREENEEEGE